MVGRKEVPAWLDGPYIRAEKRLECRNSHRINAFHTNFFLCLALFYRFLFGVKYCKCLPHADSKNSFLNQQLLHGWWLPQTLKNSPLRSLPTCPKTTKLRRKNLKTRGMIASSKDITTKRLRFTRYHYFSVVLTQPLWTPLRHSVLFFPASDQPESLRRRISWKSQLRESSCV